MNRKPFAVLLPLFSLAITLPAACQAGKAEQDGEAGSGEGGSGGRAGVAEGSGGKTFTVAEETGGTSSVGGVASSGGAAPISPEGSLSICKVAGQPSVGDPAGSLSFDDFDDGDPGFSHDGLMGGWYAYDDETEGEQVPSGDAVSPVPGGPFGSEFALRVVGSGFSFWGSGFGANFAAKGPGEECLFDASAYDGISLWIRGTIESEGSPPPLEAGRLRMQIIEKDVAPVEEGGNCDGLHGACWDSHRVRIEPTECWMKHSFRFDEFAADGWGMSGGELDLDELYLLGFEVSEDQSYDLWLDRIEFFVGTPVDEPQVCLDGGLGGAGGEGGAGN